MGSCQGPRYSCRKIAHCAKFAKVIIAPDISYLIMLNHIPSKSILEHKYAEEVIEEKRDKKTKSNLFWMFVSLSVAARGVWKFYLFWKTNSTLDPPHSPAKWVESPAAKKYLEEWLWGKMLNKETKNIRKTTQKKSQEKRDRGQWIWKCMMQQYCLKVCNAFVVMASTKWKNVIFVIIVQQPNAKI